MRCLKSRRKDTKGFAPPTGKRLVLPQHLTIIDIILHENLTGSTRTLDKIPVLFWMGNRLVITPDEGDISYDYTSKAPRRRRGAFFIISPFCNSRAFSKNRYFATFWGSQGLGVVLDRSGILTNPP